MQSLSKHQATDKEGNCTECDKHGRIYVCVHNAKYPKPGSYWVCSQCMKKVHSTVDMKKWNEEFDSGQMKLP